jgi:SpoIID/LytB domain protein
MKTTRQQPDVSVGVLHSNSIRFIFNTGYLLCGDCSDDAQPTSNSHVGGGISVNRNGCLGPFKGEQSVEFCEGKILWRGKRYDELLFVPDYGSSEELPSFWIKEVVIGINFHWERKEDQKFGGSLKIIIDEGAITAVNLAGVEDYLTSVISSEMSATASDELLKAHAVISRSWLLAQIEKNKEIKRLDANYSACSETEEERIKWYDREDHKLFDVCADDHCQRYQGLTRESTTSVRKAIEATWGEVLMFEGKICDARFSKCCGGVFEEFQNCWEPVSYPYLVKKRDIAQQGSVPDLTIESEAEKWILSSPVAFCNTTDKKILSQVLNNYDQETHNFYRWRQEYTIEELSELVKKRSGIDFGTITDLIPVERGTSGRLIKLKIVGTKRTMVFGKELEIRKSLSTSHLYSSAFVVRKEGGKFILIGAGWGHGVGLCQIGAAVMGEQGYKYDDILLHYYIGAEIKEKY